MATDYKMPRRAERCAACACPFQVGDAIRACLFETPQGYDRRDQCEACPPPDAPGMLGIWKTHRREPQTRRAGVFDPEVVLTFFRRLDPAGEPGGAPAADTPPEKLQFRFVLALLLWRKKVLRFEAADRAADGSELWRFCLAKEPDDKYLVSRPELDEAELERLSLQLEALLASDPDDAFDAPAADRLPDADPPALAASATPSEGASA